MIYDHEIGPRRCWPDLDNKRVQPHLHPPTILKGSNSLRKLCYHCLLVHPPTTCGLWSTTLYCRKSRLQIRSRASFEPRQTSCSRALSRSLLFTKSSRNTSFCVLWPNWKIGRYYHNVAVQRYPPKASGRLNYDSCNLSGESLSGRTAKKLWPDSDLLLRYGCVFFSCRGLDNILKQSEKLKRNLVRCLQW
jgi:hypothetical protein